jgi:hypothetical protein
MPMVTDVPLTDVQRRKLTKIAGYATRYEAVLRRVGGSTLLLFYGPKTQRGAAMYAAEHYDEIAAKFGAYG